MSESSIDIPNLLKPGFSEAASLLRGGQEKEADEMMVDISNRARAITKFGISDFPIIETWWKIKESIRLEWVLGYIYDRVPDGLPEWIAPKEDDDND